MLKTPLQLLSQHRVQDDIWCEVRATYQKQNLHPLERHPGYLFFLIIPQFRPSLDFCTCTRRHSDMYCSPLNQRKSRNPHGRPPMKEASSREP
ncbi:hypothetical protein KC19_VG084300, partial [Ceratodon purpureus]